MPVEEFIAHESKGLVYGHGVLTLDKAEGVLQIIFVPKVKDFAGQLLIEGYKRSNTGLIRGFEEDLGAFKLSKPGKSTIVFKQGDAWGYQLHHKYAEDELPKLLDKLRQAGFRVSPVSKKKIPEWDKSFHIERAKK